MVARGRAIGEPRLSPDGDRVAFVSALDGRASIVVVPVSGGAELTVTSDPPPPAIGGYDGGVFDWTPDGRSNTQAAHPPGSQAAHRGESRPPVELTVLDVGSVTG